MSRAHPETAESSRRNSVTRAWQRVDPRRSAALAVVLSVHATLLMLVLRPARPMRSNHTTTQVDSVDVLEVRLIDVSSPPPPIPSNAAQTTPRVRTRHASKPRLPRHAAKPMASTTSKPTESTPKTLSLKLTGKVDAANHWTIGRSLSAPKHVMPRLPGHGHVHGAPKLHLIDPRFQGIAGVARSLQHYLGIPNSHCVDVDSWRSMSPVELADHHMTESDVDRTAKRYNCIPPKRGDLSSDPFAH